MPQILVVADVPEASQSEVVYRERIATSDLESDHFSAQLVERVGWAVHDADELEQRDPRADRRPRGDQPPGRGVSELTPAAPRSAPAGRVVQPKLRDRAREVLPSIRDAPDPSYRSGGASARDRPRHQRRRARPGEHPRPSRRPAVGAQGAASVQRLRRRGQGAVDPPPGSAPSSAAAGSTSTGSPGRKRGTPSAGAGGPASAEGDALRRSGLGRRRAPVPAPARGPWARPGRRPLRPADEGGGGARAGGGRHRRRWARRPGHDPLVANRGGRRQLRDADRPGAVPAAGPRPDRGSLRRPAQGLHAVRVSTSRSAEETPIGAAGVGTVIYAAYNGGGYGNLVVIQHRLGYTSWYGHMSRIAAYVGENVVGGTRIGYVGSTGDATGPHLHFEVRHYDTPINPVPLLLSAVASSAPGEPAESRPKSAAATGGRPAGLRRARTGSAANDSVAECGASKRPSLALRAASEARSFLECAMKRASGLAGWPAPPVLESAR